MCIRDRLGYSENNYRFLKYPEREMQVSVPIQMDDGDFRVFEGFRVQHCSVRGPYKGGILSLIHISTALRFPADD